jgi:hypothetical protein
MKFFRHPFEVSSRCFVFVRKRSRHAGRRGNIEPLGLEFKSDFPRLARQFYQINPRVRGRDRIGDMQACCFPRYVPGGAIAFISSTVGLCRSYRSTSLLQRNNLCPGFHSGRCSGLGEWTTRGAQNGNSCASDPYECLLPVTSLI